MEEEYPQAGDVNLHVIASAGKFTDWLYEQIVPFLRGNILEIGSGQGTYSRKIIRDFPNNAIILSDIDRKYVTFLEGAFGGRMTFVRRIDLACGGDFARLPCAIDSVFALNVLEHVRGDIQALQNIYDALNPGGRCVLLVPAHPFLYNCIDTSVGHYRRYTRASMLEKISQTPFTMERLFSFNFLAMFAWYWHGTLRKRSVLSGGSMKVFNALVPFLRHVEKHFLRQRIGISLIAVLKK